MNSIHISDTDLDSINPHSHDPPRGLYSTNAHTQELNKGEEEDSFYQEEYNFQQSKWSSQASDEMEQEIYHAKENQIKEKIFTIINEEKIKGQEAQKSNRYCEIQNKDNFEGSDCSFNNESSSEYDSENFLDIYKDDSDSTHNNIELISQEKFLNQIESNLAEKYLEIIENIKGRQTKSSNIIKLLKQKQITPPKSPNETFFNELVKGLSEHNNNSALILRFLKMSDLEYISYDLIEQVIDVVLRYESYQEIPSLKEFIEYGQDLMKNYHDLFIDN